MHRVDGLGHCDHRMVDRPHIEWSPPSAAPLPAASSGAAATAEVGRAFRCCGEERWAAAARPMVI